MKYLIALSLICLLTACDNGQKVSTTSQTHTQTQESNTQNSQVTLAQTIHFVGPNDLDLTLKTSDNFETATLTDNSDAQYELKSVISGSGIRLANDAGVQIHFKETAGANEGFVELVKDKPIDIKEFKGN